MTTKDRRRQPHAVGTCYNLNMDRLRDRGVDIHLPSEEDLREGGARITFELIGGDFMPPLDHAFCKHISTTLGDQAVENIHRAAVTAYGREIIASAID